VLITMGQQLRLKKFYSAGPMDDHEGKRGDDGRAPPTPGPRIDFFAALFQRTPKKEKEKKIFFDIFLK
jgi:hypothetical protein